MEEQDRIETEDTDVEGHKLAPPKHDHAREEGESHEDEPDVEGHKLDTKYDV